MYDARERCYAPSSYVRNLVKDGINAPGGYAGVVLSWLDQDEHQRDGEGSHQEGMNPTWCDKNICICV